VKVAEAVEIVEKTFYLVKKIGNTSNRLFCSHRQK